MARQDQSLGTLIWNLRKAHDWSRDHLGRLTGLTARTIARIENDEVEPTDRTKQALANAFGTPIGGVRPEQPEPVAS